eukprot:14917662-Alexandrium_andersonii.AAC.1
MHTWMLPIPVYAELAHRPRLVLLLREHKVATMLAARYDHDHARQTLHAQTPTIPRAKPSPAECSEMLMREQRNAIAMPSSLTDRARPWLRTRRAPMRHPYEHHRAQRGLLDDAGA